MLCSMNNHIKQPVGSDGQCSDRFDIAMYRADDNRSVWFRVCVAAAVANEEEHVIISLIDVSARKNHEYELEQAKAAAEATSKAKDQLPANMCHEIRMPITGMVGRIDLTLRAK